MVITIYLFIYGFSYGQLSAQAKSLTPEADYYQVEPDYADKEMFDNVNQKTKNITENIVEKLNLDEPLPPRKKQFSERVENQNEKVNGIQKGYYERESQSIRE